jgi:hypothetical protein
MSVLTTAASDRASAVLARQTYVGKRLAAVSWVLSGCLVAAAWFRGKLGGLPIYALPVLAFGAGIGAMCGYLAWSSWHHGVVWIRSGPVTRNSRPRAFFALIAVLAALSVAVVAVFVLLLTIAPSRHVV